ncbi:MAG: 4'-phosphopantetheinyl transferase superfamily protein [Planctomycetota bacterium]|nr:4'-phosphopantetheinyl transferase superfamily protein [Planctomycetota bacterium]
MNLNPTPDDQTIEVWCFSLDESLERIDQLVEFLPESEKPMKNRGVVPEIGLRATVARAGLRLVLSHYLGIAAPEIFLNIGKHGKPTLDDEPIVFNLSHTESLAMVAISTCHSIGVDLERVRPDAPIEDLAARCFSPRELSQWRALPVDQQRTSFFHLWTQKESFVKAHGGGMTIPLRKFDCQVNPAKGGDLLDSRIEGDHPALWSIIAGERTSMVRYAITYAGVDHQMVDVDPQLVGLSRW